MTRRRTILVLLGVLLAGWLLLPAVRSYLLVAGRASDVPAPEGLAVESIDFGGPHTSLLRGWIVRAGPGAPAVILVHGFKTSRAEMAPWARFLHEAGYAVLLFDMRASGRSEGRFVGLGATEPFDIRAAVTAAQKRLEPSAVAVLGISLGAGAAILAAADDEAIRAVIADSAWTDQEFLLARQSSVLVGPVTVPLAPYGIALTNALVGADVRRARPLEAIARIAPRPVLLIHSADDDNATTPPGGARALYAAAREPRVLWVAPRGGHVGAISAFPEEYRSRVLAFLAAALR